ncbi:hypothetical protein Y032_0245g3546 [Ancylostoma ceylanicum]|nr:hypothetical protein Y032_0245g3546 [Ancylostoma ceylanicum]
MYRFIGAFAGLLLNVYMTVKLHKQARERANSDTSLWTVNEMKLAQSMFWQSVIPMALSCIFIIEAVLKQIFGFNALYSRIAHTLPYLVYFLTAFLPAVFLKRIRNAMIPQALQARLSNCKTSNTFLASRFKTLVP